jgi:hypothetical protein
MSRELAFESFRVPAPHFRRRSPKQQLELICHISPALSNHARSAPAADAIAATW